MPTGCRRDMEAHVHAVFARRLEVYGGANHDAPGGTPVDMTAIRVLSERPIALERLAEGPCGLLSRNATMNK